MAARINGFTVHHWSGIPFRQTEGNSTGDRQKQSIRCQALRVIIIGEAGMLSAELLGRLQYVVSQAIRMRCTYKREQMAAREFLVESVL